MSEVPSRRVGLKVGGTLAALVLLVGGGLAARTAASEEEAPAAAHESLPTVAVVRPEASAAGALALPGTIAPYNEAAINARTTGYVARWHADIGDQVRAGETLAMLDAPEVDQQLAQARADLRTALANRALADTTAKRWTAMRAKDAVSQQETDEKVGRLAAATAVADSARANVDRLRTLAGFTRITAPFSGIVTSRSAQLGALVAAGNGAAAPLFTIADINRLRVYVRVPQNLSGQLSRGMVASLRVPEHPGETFKAVLVRHAGAVDPKSGTVLTEFEVRNPERRLKPGGYADVSMPLLAQAGALQLPASSLIVGPKGTMVALVDGKGQVAMRPVTVGRDEGQSVEILAGLRPTDRVIQTPHDALTPGDRVRVVGPRQAGGSRAAR